MGGRWGRKEGKGVEIGSERASEQRSIDRMFFLSISKLTRRSAVQISLRQFSTASSSAAPSPAPMRARALPMDCPSSLRTCNIFSRSNDCFFNEGGRGGVFGARCERTGTQNASRTCPSKEKKRRAKPHHGRSGREEKEKTRKQSRSMLFFFLSPSASRE